MTRVFLVDDHEIVRRGLRDLLESAGDIDVVGEAAGAGEALCHVPAAHPAVVVLDVCLPDGNGVEVCRALRDLDPALRCLMLTSSSDDETLVDAIVAGASGFLLKQVRATDIVAAVRTIAAGGSLMDPAAVAKVIERVHHPPRDARVATLTRQERRILDLLAEGMTNRQIGERMDLTEKTVKNYVSNVLMKLGMQRRTEAAVFSARLGR